MNFDKETLKKAMDIINGLAPSQVELQVFPEGFKAIVSYTKEVKKVGNPNLFGYIGNYYGLRITVIEDYMTCDESHNCDDYDNMKMNQGRMIYSDGTTKIIDIYKLD